MKTPKMLSLKTLLLSYLRNMLTLSRSAPASWLTKSLSAPRTASGSMSATDMIWSARDGDMARVGDRERSRIGEPVRGMGLPRPPDVVL